MNLKIRYVLLLWLMVFTTGYATAQDSLFNPLTYQSQVTDTFFGTPVPDPYRWLEEPNSAQTAAWLSAQRSITRKARSEFMYKYMGLYTMLDQGNMYHTDYLIKEGGYYFNYTVKWLSQPPVLYYRNALVGHDTIAYDANTENGKSIYTINHFALSADNRYLAVLLSKQGSDWLEIRVRDLHTKHDLSDRVGEIKMGRVQWHGNGFFYTRHNANSTAGMHLGADESEQLCYHQLGTAATTDKVIYNVPAQANLRFAYELTLDKKYLVLYTIARTGDGWSNVIAYKDLANGIFSEAKLLMSFPAGEPVLYDVIDVVNDRFIILSDYNAPNSRIISVHKDSMNTGTVLVPEFTETLQKVTCLDNKLFCLYFDNGNYKGVLYDYTGKALTSIPFAPGCDVTGFYGGKTDTVAVFRQTGFYHPAVTCTLNTRQSTAAPLFKTYVYFNHEEFETKVVTYPSADSTLVPMYLTYRKGTKLTGNNPVLLYGYGGFGISTTPFFDYGNVAFCASGGILAVPLIRGGGEKGSNWHLSGSGLNKQNSFNDFKAAAAYLIKQNYTTSSRMAIMGASNGGLLVGAMLAQNPGLFRAAVANVGLYDMLRYEKFTVGRSWVSEYGSVNNRAQFNNLYSYSPYHNLQPRSDYPATLITTAKNDDRVPALHSFKFLARLQQQSKSNRPHLLYFEEEAGHNGGITFNSYTAQRAIVWSFIFKQLDMPLISDF